MSLYKRVTSLKAILIPRLCLRLMQNLKKTVQKNSTAFLPLQYMKYTAKSFICAVTESVLNRFFIVIKMQSLLLVRR